MISPPPRIIALVPNLFFASRIRTVADRTGYEVEIARSQADYSERLAARPADLVIVDLAQPGIDLAAIVRQARGQPAGPARVLAFGPHVDAAAARAARAAGCDRVVANSKLATGLPELLEQMTTDDRRPSNWRDSCGQQASGSGKPLPY